MSGKHIGIILTALVFMFMSVPGTASAAAGKIVIAQGAEQRAIDAHKGGSNMWLNTSFMIYDALIRRTWDGKLEPNLAASWKTITPETWGDGIIDPSDPQTILFGGVTQFLMTPGTGSHVGTVYVDGFPIGSVTQYTFVYVTADHTISVTFASIW